MLERQRKEEEQLRLRLEEEKRHSEELLIQLKLEQHKKQKATQKAINGIIGHAIQAAAVGLNKFETPLKSRNPEILIEELSKLGFSAYICEMSSWWEKTENFIGKLVSKIEVTDSAEHYKHEIFAALHSRDEPHLLGIVRELKDDSNLALSTSVKGYIQQNVLPHLEVSSEEHFEEYLEVQWVPIDVHDAHFEFFHQVPAWMLSTGGEWLLKRMGECYERDAELGQRCSVFQLDDLPIVSDRWGVNHMTKYLHDGTPIGVCPFSEHVFMRAMKALGFEVTVGTGKVKTLTVSW